MEINLEVLVLFDMFVSKGLGDVREYSDLEICGIAAENSDPSRRALPALFEEGDRQIERERKFFRRILN